MTKEKELQTEELVATIGEEPTKIPIKLNIRKALDGKILIRDHDRFEVVISPTEGVMKTFPKEENSDITFRAQQRFIEFLVDRGVVDRETIQGGNTYGSLRVEMIDTETESQDALQLLLFSIYKYMEKERPKFRYTSDLLKQQIKDLTDPPEEGATDPYEVKKKEDKLKMHRQANMYDGMMGGDYPFYGSYYF